MHGRVVLAMTKVRCNYCIPTLRKLTKSVVGKSCGCKRFNLLLYPGVKLGPLRNDKTEQAMPFQVIGTDFAGSIYYRSKAKKESKVYILIFSCSVSSAVHLELKPSRSVYKIFETINST